MARVMVLHRAPAVPRRRFARAAGPMLAVGALIMLGALIAAPGPWTQGYVSEAGTGGRPFAVAYRCGLVLLALGVALLAVALSPVTRLAALLLGTSATLAATSGAVPCSRRCPLPPFEPTTLADVVHTATSIAGMAVLAAAMLVIALSPVRPGLRRPAAAAVVLTVPLGGWMGLTMLLAGRGPLGSTLERVLLAVAVAWLVWTAAAAALPEPPG
jgi:hypothetical protein